MSRALVVAICVLASAGLAGCDDAGQVRGARTLSPSPATSSPSPSPVRHVPPRRALIEAIDRIPPVGTYSMSVLTSSGTDVWDVRGDYDLGRAAARMALFYSQELHPDRVKRDLVLAVDDRAFALTPGSVPGPDVCWMEMDPGSLAELVGRGDPHRLGLAPIDLLGHLTVTGEDRVAQRISATLPIRFAVTLFGPELFAAVQGPDRSARGSVPVELTVVDGQVQDWTITGADVAGAVGSWGIDKADIRKLEGVNLTVRLSSGGDEIEDIQVPPPGKITQGLEVPCADERSAA
jgi:hypothetical protein